MARAHFVKKARKDVPSHGIKKGDSYYWWQFAYSRKSYSKTAPKPSQLTRSNFWSQIFALQERNEPEFDDVASEVEDIKGELENIRDECQGSFDNMPDGLQQGDTGQMLEERVQECDDVISELDSVDASELDDESITDEVREENKDKWSKLSDEQKKESVTESKQQRVDEIWQSVTDALSSISCS